jgi:hypothetical protein
MQTKTMNGEWCQKTWNESPLDTLVRFDGDNYYKMLNGHVAQITAGSAIIYYDWNNAEGYDESIRFDTVKIVPQARGFQGDSQDKNWTPMKRADKRGHSKPTTLKDIVAYLNGSFVGETKVELKHNRTFVTLYKD